MIKVYSYAGCGSCRKALKWFAEKGLSVETVAIRETPPSAAEIEYMIEQYGGQFRKVFNVSGQAYRGLGLKDKLGDMSQSQIVELLSEDGNLVKRPFVLWGDRGSVGFKESEWDSFID